MTTATLIDTFRPIRSATGPLIRDPAHAASYTVLVVSTFKPMRNLTKQKSGNEPPFEPRVTVYSRENSTKALHCDDTRDHTLVISEQEATES